MVRIALCVFGTLFLALVQQSTAAGNSGESGNSGGSFGDAFVNEASSQKSGKSAASAGSWRDEPSSQKSQKSNAAPPPAAAPAATPVDSSKSSGSSSGPAAPAAAPAMPKPEAAAPPVAAQPAAKPLERQESTAGGERPHTDNKQHAGEHVDEAGPTSDSSDSDSTPNAATFAQLYLKDNQGECVWKYIGCKGGQAGKLVRGRKTLNAPLPNESSVKNPTPASCTEACLKSGYKVAAIGSTGKARAADNLKCYCGDSLGASIIKNDQGTCNAKCYGEDLGTGLCGGAQMFNVYKCISKTWDPTNVCNSNIEWTKSSGYNFTDSNGKPMVSQFYPLSIPNKLFNGGKGCARACQKGGFIFAVFITAIPEYNCYCTNVLQHTVTGNMDSITQYSAFGNANIWKCNVEDAGKAIVRNGMGVGHV